MKNDFQGYAIYSQFGFVIITSVVVGIFLGKKLDEIFNTSPIFLLVFIILGIMSSFINFFFKIMKQFDDSKYLNKYIYIINFITESIFLVLICFIIGNVINNNYCTILLLVIAVGFSFKRFKKLRVIFRRKNNENM